MVPRLGEKYNVNVELTSRSREEYRTEAYYELDLPVAPAIRIDDEIVVEGCDIAEESLEAAVCRHIAAGSA
jgi:hypothetical protein